MSPTPAVTCSGCGFSWNSSAMAEGLRLLGSCPKCGSVLEFHAGAPREEREPRFEPGPEPAPVPQRTAPHLVLGIPRR